MGTMKLLTLALAAPLLAAHMASGQCPADAAPDAPRVTITNGKLAAVVHLPDSQRGYYRSNRFDWSGSIACATLNGHTFWGQWFSHYDPLGNDAITGPAEEFRSPDGAEPGYNEAAPGGLFVKLGVGVLRRLDEKPYSFGGKYPIVDTGTWTSTSNRNSVTSTQVVHSAIGFDYRYTKTVEIDKKANIVRLRHTLTNLGKRPIDSALYNHVFLQLDGKGPGPGTSVTLAFAPTVETLFPDSVSVEDRTIRFLGPPPNGRAIGSYLTGYTPGTPNAAEIIDTTTGLRVRQKTDAPIVKFYFWGHSRATCPEAYIAIHVAPGKTQRWTTEFSLEAPAAAAPAPR